jgi:hypothetical protein
MEIVSSEKKQELEKQNNSLLEKVEALSIDSEQHNTNATLFLKEIKKMRVNVNDTFKPAVSAAKNAYDEARALRDNFLKPIENAERVIRQKIGLWVQAENKRLTEIAAAEAKAREKEIKKAEKKAEKTGKPIDMPQPIAPIKTKVSTPAGISHTVRWSAEVTDIVALCKAIGAGKVMPELVLPNIPALNKLAQVSKENLNIAGVKAVSTVSTSVR